MDTPKLAAALARAQGAFETPRKTRKVDFTDKNGRRVHYTYADLADVIACVRKPLSENRLAVVHRFDDDGGFGMETMLMHESGESLCTWYPLPAPHQVQPKEFGSAITYARRYALSALLGIASEEDDDGDDAPAPAPSKPRAQAPAPSGQPSPIAVRPPAPQNPPPVRAHADPDTARKYLFATAEECGWTHEQIRLYIDHVWKIASTKDLTPQQHDELIRQMRTHSYQKAMAGMFSRSGPSRAMPEQETEPGSDG